MKYCTGCHQEKPFESFSKSKRSKDGRQHYCKSCSRQHIKNSLLKRDPAEVAAAKHAWYQRNREREIARTKRYRQDNPEWANQVDAKHHASYNWRERFPERAKASAARQSRERRFRKHGLTQTEYDVMLAAQKYVCAACKEVPSTSSVRPGVNKYDDFVIDHDHITGKVRGLVCTNCNVALGMIRDNPETARKLAEYLEGFGDKVSPTNSGSEVHQSGNSPVSMSIH